MKVPAAVPSLRHSSRPVAEEPTAEKYSTPPDSTSELGEE
jgi:hypothetical protein